MKSKEVEEKKLLVNMPKEMWQRLRKLAFDKNVSMNQLCREGIEYILKKESGKK
jgi:predicted DNA-binding protein